METQTRLTAKEELICQSIKDQIIMLAIEGSMDCDMTQLDVQTLYANALEINKEAIDLENAIDNLLHYTSYDTREEAKEAVLKLEELYENSEKCYDSCVEHDFFMWEQTEELTIKELYGLVF